MPQHRTPLTDVHGEQGWCQSVGVDEVRVHGADGAGQRGEGADETHRRHERPRVQPAVQPYGRNGSQRHAGVPQRSSQQPGGNSRMHRNAAGFQHHSQFQQAALRAAEFP